MHPTTWRPLHDFYNDYDDDGSEHFDEDKFGSPCPELFYGCGAKDCTKLFHAAEFVYKHLKLKHPSLAVEQTSKLREDLYTQNYMKTSESRSFTFVYNRWCFDIHD